MAPKIKRYDPSIKILGVDDQRFTVPLWFNAVSDDDKMFRIIFLPDPIGITIWMSIQFGPKSYSHGQAKSYPSYELLIMPDRATAVVL